MSKASLPAGMRDFSPGDLVKRNFIFDIIKNEFRNFGFRQIETPAIENIETLTGKYGDEGDKLLFRILNSGDFLKDINPPIENSSDLTPLISGKGLRYDLTVPFARFVAMNSNEFQFPFKRFQIQPVWRADRPQKGRYREFYQCDADVVGSDSLLYEAEFIQLFDRVFDRLNIRNLELKLNNRKILFGIAQAFGLENSFKDLTIALDKLDKVGLDGVARELEKRDIPSGFLEELKLLLEEKNTGKKLNHLDELLKDSETGKKGLEEFRQVMAFLEGYDFRSCTPVLDITLARGLDYYTGMIFEVVPSGIKIGSIASGGRYDDLTAYFGLPGVSGVGIAFGAERVFDLMNELNLFPALNEGQPTVFITNFGPETEKYCFDVMTFLRENDIPVEMYPSKKALKKQFSYANKRNIPFVVTAGPEEEAENTLQVKNMGSGEQEKITKEAFVKKLKENDEASNRSAASIH